MMKHEEIVESLRRAASAMGKKKDTVLIPEWSTEPQEPEARAFSAAASIHRGDTVVSYRDAAALIHYIADMLE
jgi:hypothetical protein